MGKPRTYSCWDTSVKIQEAGHGLGVYGNTYEVFPGGGYTRTGDAIMIHMTPGIRFLIKDVDAAIAEADRRNRAGLMCQSAPNVDPTDTNPVG